MQTRFGSCDNRKVFFILALLSFKLEATNRPINLSKIRSCNSLKSSSMIER